MLKLKYLFENFDLAKECLALYEYSEKNQDIMFQYFRISSNAVYPFYANDEGCVCFLRLSPIEEKSPADVESEIHFIAWLFENGFPVMKPYAMKNGKLHDVIKTEWGEYNVSCFESVSGQTLEDAEGSTELAFGYGRTLGELHNKAEEYPYSEERRSYRELLAEIKERLEMYHAPQTVLTELGLVTDELCKLEVNNKCFGLVHYDFEPDNVLYDEKNRQFGVIDLDDSIRCWYALDVVRAIDAMDDVVGEEQAEDAISAFVNGYRSVRELSEEQLESMPIMRRLVSLQEYATIVHVLSEPPEAEPDWMIHIVKKLSDKLQRIEESM